MDVATDNDIHVCGCLSLGVGDMPESGLAALFLRWALLPVGGEARLDADGGAGLGDRVLNGLDEGSRLLVGGDRAPPATEGE